MKKMIKEKSIIKQTLPKRGFQYFTYKVTSQLQEGKSALAYLLGNGRYNVESYTNWGYSKASWKDRSTCLLQL